MGKNLVKILIKNCKSGSSMLVGDKNEKLPSSVKGFQASTYPERQDGSANPEISKIFLSLSGLL
jgi:hypothetical protein